MSNPEEIDFFQLAQSELLGVDIPPLDYDEWSPEILGNLFIGTNGPLIDYSFPELPSQSPQVTSYQNLQDMSPPIHVNSLNQSPTGAQIKNPSNNQLTANTSSMLSQTRGTHASSTSNVGQSQVQHSDSLQKDLLLIDQCLGLGYFLKDLSTARTKCIRDIQRLHVGLGAESEGKKPEETGLCKAAFLDNTSKTIDSSMASIAESLKKMENELESEKKVAEMLEVKIETMQREAEEKRVKDKQTLYQLRETLMKTQKGLNDAMGIVIQMLNDNDKM